MDAIFIPCEVCDEPIHMFDYETHVRECNGANTYDEYTANLNLAEQMGGNVVIGLSKEQIKNTFYVKRNRTHQWCTICHDFSEHKTMLVTPCNHMYCRKCILKWVHQSSKCPVCMTDMSEAKTK